MVFNLSFTWSFKKCTRPKIWKDPIHSTSIEKDQTSGRRGETNVEDVSLPQNKLKLSQYRQLERKISSEDSEQVL